jgi:hypothetical protein
MNAASSDKISRSHATHTTNATQRRLTKRREGKKNQETYTQFKVTADHQTKNMMTPSVHHTTRITWYIKQQNQQWSGAWFSLMNQLNQSWTNGATMGGTGLWNATSRRQAVFVTGVYVKDSSTLRRDFNRSRKQDNLSRHGLNKRRCQLKTKSKKNNSIQGLEQK